MVANRGGGQGHAARGVCSTAIAIPGLKSLPGNPGELTGVEFRRRSLNLKIPCHRKVISANALHTRVFSLEGTVAGKPVPNLCKSCRRRVMSLSFNRGGCRESGTMRTNGGTRHGGQTAMSGIDPAMPDASGVASPLTDLGGSVQVEHLLMPRTAHAAVVAVTVHDRHWWQLMSSRGRHPWPPACPGSWPTPQPPPGALRRWRRPSPSA
jgi:hypothetical protein